MPETIFGNLHAPDGTEIVDAYRYQLYRGERCPPFDDKPKSEKTLCFVMLNPSTADATKDDPTIRRCRGYAVRWGFQHLYIVNLFAYRSPSPEALRTMHQLQFDVVGPLNDRFILDCAKEADMVIVAWGRLHPALEWRAKEVCAMLRENLPAGIRALGLTKAGHPRHPLYLPEDITPFPF